MNGKSAKLRQVRLQQPFRGSLLLQLTVLCSSREGCRRKFIIKQAQQFPALLILAVLLRVPAVPMKILKPFLQPALPIQRERGATEVLHGQQRMQEQTKLLTIKAITVRNGSLTSGSSANGIGSLTVTTQLKFSRNQRYFLM